MSTPRMPKHLKAFFLKWLEKNRPDFYRDKEKQMEFEHELNCKAWREAEKDIPEHWKPPFGESWHNV